MSATKTRFHGFLDPLAKILEIMLMFFMAVLVADVLWGVASRYLLGEQSRWTEELAIYLLIWVSLVGGALTYRDKGHLGVDFMIRMMHKDAHRTAHIIANLAVLGFSAVALLYGGYILVDRTLESGQVSPALGWPVGYVYMAAPVSGAFFILFAIEQLITKPDNLDAEIEEVAEEREIL